jgi:hypothetical protein
LYTSVVWCSIGAFINVSSIGYTGSFHTFRSMGVVGV